MHVRLARIGLFAPALFVTLGACVAADESRSPSDSVRAAATAASSAGDTAAPAPLADSGRAAAPPAPTATQPSAREAAASSPRTATAPGRPAASGKPRRVLLGDIDLTGVGYDRGSVTAPVVVIDFSDFGCPYCAQFSRETYPVLEKEYVSTGKVYFKYVPFIMGMFPHAEEATRAVECAADQGRFWPMADRVYEAQKSWKGGGDPRALLLGMADLVGADSAAVGKCYADRRTDSRTSHATYIASRVGVRVTPSFVVNERPIEGALPLAEFRKVIDAALLLALSRR